MTYLRCGPLVIVISMGLSTARGSQRISALTPEKKEPTVPSIRWALTTEFDKNGPNDPLVVKDKVIVGTDRGELRAYRCKDGESLWIHQHGERIFHQPCSDGQRVYFSSAKGLTAVSASDGTEVWNFSHPWCDGPTLVLGKREMVYVGGNDGNLYALDAKTGKQAWTADFLADAPPDPPGFSGERARLQNTRARPTALASDGKSLFLSVFDQCRIVAFDATDGKRLWDFRTGGWIFGSAVATEKHVFFGSQDKVFYCVDKQTGRQVWRHETKGRIESGGAVDKQFVYFGSCDGGLYCLNQSDGKVRWRFAADREDGHNSAIYSVPVIRRGGVYFAAGEGQMYAIDQRTGALKWKLRASEMSELYCSAAPGGALLFVVTRPRGAGQGEASLVAIGEDGKPTQAKRDRIDGAPVEALIAKLGDDSYQQREAAHKQLAQLGEPAIELLQWAARESPDAEVRERAERLLAGIESRLFPTIYHMRGNGSPVTRIALTPDGTGFIAAAKGPLGRGSFQVGTSIKTFGSQQFYWAVAVSADGKRVIAGPHDRIARVYELETGKQVQELIGHQGEIWGVALLPDGKRELLPVRKTNRFASGMWTVASSSGSSRASKRMSVVWHCPRTEKPWPWAIFAKTKWERSACGISKVDGRFANFLGIALK